MGFSGVGLTWIGALKTVTCDLVLYFLLYDVINVSVDLFVKALSLFVVIQISKSFK